VQRPTLFAFLHRPKILEQGGIDKWSWSISVTVPPSMSKKLRSDRENAVEPDLCVCLDHANARKLPDAMPLGPLLEPMLSYLAKDFRTPSETPLTDKIGALSSSRSMRSQKIETDIACSADNKQQ